MAQRDPTHASGPKEPHCPRLTRRRLLAAGAAACAAPALPARAQSREYDIKAAFLFNFIKFVDWPPQALPDGGGSIVIGILGTNPFGSSLAAIQGKSVRGKTIAVRQIANASEATSCHVLFISGSERERLRSVLDTLRGASVLTVGETRGFAQSGVIINFTIQDERVRFEINPAAADRARLTISSQLLRLARIVRS